MKKFHFRPETLLKIREQTRDERRGELADAQRTDDELLRRTADLESKRKQVQYDCREASKPGTLNIPRLKEARQFDETLRLQQLELNERRRALAEEIERRRVALIEADRDVRTLEKLREHQFQTHRRNEDRLEARDQESGARDQGAEVRDQGAEAGQSPNHQITQSPNLPC
jgi:flagellar protein FliJ